MSAPKHVYEVYIRTTPERLWQAITDSAFVRRYYFGSDVESDWRPGSTILYTNPERGTDIEGTILEADPPRRLVHTFAVKWDPEALGDRPSRVTWEIVPMGEACQLTVTHDDFDAETKTFRSTGAMGWTVILSGLKTLLETGEELRIEAPVEASA